jgi:hypothetical protein
MTDQLSHDHDKWMPLTRGECAVAWALILGGTAVFFALAFAAGYWAGVNS